MLISQAALEELSLPTSIAVSFSVSCSGRLAPTAVALSASFSRSGDGRESWGAVTKGQGGIAADADMGVIKKDVLLPKPDHIHS